MKKFLVILNEIYRFIKRKCRRLTGTMVRSRTLKAYLSSHHVHKLQIGAGANILGGSAPAEGHILHDYFAHETHKNPEIPAKSGRAIAVANTITWVSERLPII